MVKLINALTGSEMYVADERVDEYLARGHRLPGPVEKAPENKEPAKAADKPVAKKGTKKK